MRVLRQALCAAVVFFGIVALAGCTIREDEFRDVPTIEPSPTNTPRARATPTPTATRGRSSFEPECYGNRFEPCLKTSITIDTPGVTSADCSGSERRVCVVPVGAVWPDLIEHVSTHFRGMGIPLQVTPGMDIPRDRVDMQFSQAVHWNLERLATEKYLSQLEGWQNVTLIVLTPIDVRPRDGMPGDFVFSSRFGQGNDRWTSVISTFRFNPETFGEPRDDRLFFERVRKMMLKYIGADHFGHPETDSEDSVMRVYINSLRLLDSLPERLPEGVPPCRQRERRICLVPVGEVDRGLLERVAADAEATYGIPVDVIEGTQFDESYRDLIRGQFSADRTLLTMWEAYPRLLRIEPIPTLVAVTPEPIYSDYLLEQLSQASQEEILAAQVFAVSNIEWPAGIISMAWDRSASSGSSDRDEARLRKLLAHIIGQVHFGMPDPDDPGNLLSLITSVEQLDALPERLPGY